MANISSKIIVKETFQVEKCVADDVTSAKTTFSNENLAIIFGIFMVIISVCLLREIC